MSTRVYGQSDDLIEAEGDVYGEVGFFSRGEEGDVALLVCADGTILGMQYSPKLRPGIWCIELVSKGSLFDRIEKCTDANADPYSDQAFFRDGLTGIKVATAWEEMK